MSDDDEDIDDDDDDVRLVSTGRIADPKKTLESVFSEELREKFELFSYRNAGAILSKNFPDQMAQIINALERFEITTEMIRKPGGNKGPIADYVDTLFSNAWVETRISANLEVKLTHAKQRNVILHQYTRDGYLDGHRIDFVNGKVALDLEWNSKDQTYDRDLYAFSAFYDAGAIDVGVILTRGSSIDNPYLRKLGKVLKKDGTEGADDVVKKFGSSTTWMGKLLYRLDAGRNGGCPVLAIGITPRCIK
jgi:hypothetical protein